MSETKTCNATKSLGRLELVCDREPGHAGQHEDNSMRPSMHFSWDDKPTAEPADVAR